MATAGATVSAAEVLAEGGSARALRVRLRLRTALSGAHGRQQERQTILVALNGADHTGWGECPALADPGYSAETIDTAWAALSGGGPLGPMARGAIADAALDLELRVRGVSLAAELGATATTVPVCRVVSFGGDRGGEDRIKLKVVPGLLDSVRQWRRRCPNRPLALDANGSFADVAAVPDWLDELNLEYLEAPFAPGDTAAAAEFRQRFRTPVAQDEGVSNSEDVTLLAAAGAADLISVKPARLGGLAAAWAVANVAIDHGLGVFVGGMVEGGPGRALAVALAAALAERPEGAWPTDVGPSARYYATELGTPVLRGDDGISVTVPTGSGCGWEPDPEVLDGCIIETCELDLSTLDLSQPGLTALG
jgi:O-succinylbenzoate synthase